MIKIENIKFGDMITLEDGKEYCCFGTLNDDKCNYLCLVSNTKVKHYVYAKEIIDEEGIGIEIIEDKNLLKYINELFNKKYK